MHLVATAAVAPLLAAPSVRAEQLTQLVLGETGSLLAREGEWRQVRTHIDAYDAWVHAGYVRELDDTELTHWRTRATGWSAGAVLHVGGRPLRLPLRSRVALDGERVGLPDGRVGLVGSGAVAEQHSAGAAARTIAPERWALDCFEGTPYQWGGVTPWGVDCSGLVQTTFLARGGTLPRDSGLQATVGEPVELDALQAGDLLFFRSESGSHISHVAFYGPDNTLVHSTIACGGVLAESFGPGSRAAALRERLVAARRLEPR